MISFTIKSLTPIWSGDIEGKSERLRQTSIVGSLRYFGEAVLRGFDIYVCPIVYDAKIEDNSVKKCRYKREEHLSSICTGCYIWGTTNWQRQVRISFDNHSSISSTNFQDDNRWITEVLGKGSGNFKAIWISNANMSFIPLNTYNTEDILDTENYIHLLMKTIKELGHIGAKGRTGFGFVDIEGIDEQKVKKAIHELRSLRRNIFRDENKSSNIYRILSNIRRFVRLDFKIQDTSKFLGSLSNTFIFRGRPVMHIPRDINEFYIKKPSGFYIKYFLRKKLKKSYSNMFGSTSNGSQLYSSHIIKEGNTYKFRVIIEFQDGFVDAFIKDIKNTLTQAGCIFEKEVTFDKGVLS
ncbi:MAG TPA: type III-B CRISPR module RAMP protein Cmr1 [Hydrogenobaculum sp.]|nr:type III-B CRISPR module RAMP protein Cmr1 [Hydrogenobaculum sp.]